MSRKKCVRVYANGEELVGGRARTHHRVLSLADLHRIEVALRLRVESRLDDDLTPGLVGGTHRRVLEILELVEGSDEEAI